VGGRLQTINPLRSALLTASDFEWTCSLSYTFPDIASHGIETDREASAVDQDADRQALRIYPG